MVHIIPAPFSIDNADMVSHDYIAVFALHILHRLVLYASFSSFLNPPLSHLNVSSSYAVDSEEVVLEDADQGSRMYEVDKGCAYGSSWEVISTQRMVREIVVEEVNLSTSLLELLKAIVPKGPNREVVVANASGTYFLMAP